MKQKRVLALVLALLLLLALAGCGSAASYDTAKMEAATTTATASSSGWYYEAAEEEAADYGAYNDSVVYKTESAALSAGETGSKLPENVKLIYTANIDMESTEFDASVSGLKQMVSALGGYFQSSDLNNYGTYRYAYYTIRVPAENFDAFCENVGQLCQINNISRSAEDVSEYYYDTEARLTTQQTKLERLQKLLAEAELMEDIIQLESAISETELAIENLTGTLRHYDSLVGYSTVNLSLSEVYKLTETEPAAIGFGAKLASAFRTGSTRFVNGLENAALSIARGWIGWVIFLIVVAVIVIAVLRIVKRARRGNKTENAARAAAPGRAKNTAQQAKPAAPEAPKQPEDAKPE